MNRIEVPVALAESARAAVVAERDRVVAGVDPQAFVFDDLFERHEIGEVSDDGSVEVILYGAIGGLFGIDAWAFAKDLKKVDASTLNVRLDTGGGSIFDGIAIYNALVDHPANVVMTVDSVAASMGSVILQAADERIMNRGAQLMIHNPWAAYGGTAEEFRDVADFLDGLRSTLVDIYAARSDSDVTTWDDQLVDKDTWLSAEAAVELGLADAVVAMKTPDKNEDDPAQAVASAARTIDAANQVGDDSTSDSTPDSSETAAMAAVELERQRAEQVVAEALAVSARTRAMNP